MPREVRSYGVYLRTHVPLSCAPAIPLAGINLSVDHTIGQLEDDSDMSEVLVLYSTWVLCECSSKMNITYNHKTT